MRRLVALLLAALVLVPTAAFAKTASHPGHRVGTDGWTQTKTLTRDWTQNGAPQHDSRDVTVNVDKHTDLQARERINVTWSGAHPSGGRAANPFGLNGMNQEYPVVIMECRGTDDPSLPAAQQLSQNTCWTGSWPQRTEKLAQVSAAWTHDQYAAPGDAGQLSGVSSLPSDCQVPDSSYAHITPFNAANGKVFSGCSNDTMPPEAAIGSADPPNEQEAFTDTSGNGSAAFEVRTEAENQSLGCSHTVACSLVVIPIEGLSCSDNDPECNRSGEFAPGSSNFANDAVDLSVSPFLWWSASNWRNRFSVPLEFAPPPSTCQLLGTGAPVTFYGSALLGQATLQWAPSYCLDKKRFNWQANTMPDDAAFALMSAGGADAALVTGPRKPDDKTVKVGYAPTAVTGFGIAFDIDKPGNAGQLTSLKLNARLLAKLLTMSYPASTMGQAHPGLDKNPISLNQDPEFQELNPGLDAEHFSEAASTLLSLSTSSDVIKAITSYIANDADAEAFMQGKPDPYGMTVNPAYKKLKLPVSTWPILDTWIPSTPGQACLANNPAPYLPKVAAPVSGFQQISTAMILNWPNVQTVCDTDPVTGLYKLGRIAPQGVGSRFMLGLVTLGDAARYGLPVASLQASPGHYVDATNDGMAAAVKLAQQQTKTDAFVIDQKKIRKSSSAYPGTLVISTAARLSGMQKAAAKRVSTFITISSTQGQVVGRGNGQLPQGYLPITKSGVTGKLFKADRLVSAKILAQKAPKAATPKPASTPKAAAPAPAAQAPASAPAPVAVKPAPAVQAPVTKATTVPVAHTAPTRNSAGGILLPLLLFVGLTGGLLAGISRFLARGGA